MAMQRAQEYILEEEYAYLEAAELRALEAEFARMTYVSEPKHKVLQN